MVLTVLIGVLLITMMLGVPIAWCLGISGLAALMLMDMPLSIVPQKIFSGMDIFPMLCLPFFILAGEIMAHGGLSKRLLHFAVIW